VAAVIDSNVSADYDLVYTRFSEPLIRTSAESGTFNFSDNNSIGANVREIIYLGYDTSFPGANGYKVRVKINNRAINTGETLSISNITDLHINPMNPDQSLITFKKIFLFTKALNLNIQSLFFIIWI
jgi:hypothetical protein